MTQIYCQVKDCEYNEEGTCGAGAIRVNEEKTCDTYQHYQVRAEEKGDEAGDRLIWDLEYFEDDPTDGETVL